MLESEGSLNHGALQDPSGTLTVLRCVPGCWATKTYARDPGGPDKYVKVADYKAGETFSFLEKPWTGIEGLAAHLDGLGGDPGSFILAGAPAGLARDRGEWGQNVYRRPGTPPICFEERAISFLYDDTDGVPAPDGVGETSDEALAYLDEAGPPPVGGGGPHLRVSGAPGLGVKGKGGGGGPPASARPRPPPFDG